MSPPRSRILVAEDDEAVLELLRIRLELAGYHTFYARDGYRAIETAARVMPHGIVLDIGLPKGDGFEVLSSVKSDRRLKHIPVLMLTARHEAGDVQKSIAWGAQDYVTKPFDDKKLIQRIGRMLAKPAPDTGRAYL